MDFKTTVPILAASILVGAFAVAQTPDSREAKAMMKLWMGPSFSETGSELISAIDKCNELGVMSALKKGADANYRGLEGETPLMLVCQNCKSVKIAEALLHHGAKPDIMNVSGLTALMIAARSFSPELTKLLLENGAHPNIRSHDPDAVSSNMAGTEGYTALMFASRTSTAEMIKILLDRGADPRCVGADGRTALDIVRQRGAWREQEAAAMLLQQKLK